MLPGKLLRNSLDHIEYAELGGTRLVCLSDSILGNRALLGKLPSVGAHKSCRAWPQGQSVPCTPITPPTRPSSSSPASPADISATTDSREAVSPHQPSDFPSPQVSSLCVPHWPGGARASALPGATTSSGLSVWLLLTSARTMLCPIPHVDRFCLVTHCLPSSVSPRFNSLLPPKEPF